MRVERKYCVWPLALTAWLLCSAAWQGVAAGYEGKLWNFLDAKAVMSAASGITTNNYPDCDEATVDGRMVRVYRADGTGEAQDEFFTKVLTEKGKRGNRTVTLSFMLPYNSVEVVKLEVLGPGGEVAVVDVAANSKESINDSQMQMNIYDPNDRVLRVSIPKLEVGDVVHSITRTTTLRSIVPGEFAEWNVFEGRGAVEHLVYEVHGPSEKPLKRIALRDEVPATVRHTEQRGAENEIVHRWEVEGVPRMFDEPAMPPYSMVLQRLIVSTIPSWEDLSKWYWKLSEPHLEATTPDMAAKVRELTSGGKTDLERVKALFYYVSGQVRYMGLTPEKDRPGFEPHDVRLTFEKKYGVCRDKAALLVSMLRMAGLKSYPVLINVGSKKDAEVPDPFFNHAIVSAELKPGEYVLMDPTDENTKDLLPASECDQSYLVCRPEGERIRVSPVRPPEENMMRVVTKGRLENGGRLTASSVLSFEGINDNTYRSLFSRMKPDDEQRFFERALKRTLPGARLQSFKVEPADMTDMSRPLRAMLEYVVEDATASGTGKAMVNLPWIGKGMGIVNFILGGTGLEKRKYPMQTFVACGLSEELAIELGEGFGSVLSQPSFAPVDDRTLAYSQRVAMQGRTLQGTRELKLKVVEFSPKEYAGLKKTLQNLEYDERKAPILAVATAPEAMAAATKAKAPVVESHARVLESTKSLEVYDEHSATYRVRYAKRILTYNGKKREAELKLDYNPSCQQARLVKGVVISAKGERHEVGPGEINVMDAGWNASAKRYTGGKILVANLPGVEIGSTIEVEFEIVSTNRPFLAGFEAFQLQDELDQKSFRLEAPAGMKLHKLITGPGNVVSEQSSAREPASKQSFSWHSGRVPALPAESQLPPEWLCMAGLGYAVGEFGDYLGELNRIMLDRAQHAKNAEKLAREITAKCTNARDRVTAIRDYIARNIRMAGPSFTELPLSELSAADTTLGDGYGHWADRAILFHAMLTAAGFKPEFVLGSGLPPLPEITNVLAALPLPSSFQAPLVKVAVDGETYYLNDTDQYAKLGATTFDGKLGLVLPSPQWVVIRAPEFAREKTETSYTLALGENGKATVGVTREYFGSVFGAKNRFFSELPPEERKRYYQELVSDLAQGAHPLSDLSTKFDCYPGIEQFTVEIDKYSVRDGRYLYFDLPFTPSMFPGGSDERVQPFYIGREAKSTVRAQVAVPPGFRSVAIGPASGEMMVPSRGGRARITSARGEDGKLVVSYDLETTPAIIRTEDYPAVLKLETELGKRASRMFLMEGEPRVDAN